MDTHCEHYVVTGECNDDDDDNFLLLDDDNTTTTNNTVKKYCVRCRNPSSKCTNAASIVEIENSWIQQQQEHTCNGSTMDVFTAPNSNFMIAATDRQINNDHQQLHQGDTLEDSPLLINVKYYNTSRMDRS